MATFISPTGNPEVWDEKPEGYLTREEWEAARPLPAPEELAERRIAAIKARLNAIDLAMIRGLDARDEGTATEDDEAKLAELRAEKRALRAELAEIA